MGVGQLGASRAPSIQHFEKAMPSFIEDAIPYGMFLACCGGHRHEGTAGVVRGRGGAFLVADERGRHAAAAARGLHSRGGVGADLGADEGEGGGRRGVSVLLLQLGALHSLDDFWNGRRQRKEGIIHS